MTVTSYYRVEQQSDNRATIVPDCFWPRVYPMTSHLRLINKPPLQTINWTRFCVTDNDFCNSLLFSIKLFSLQFHVYIYRPTLDLTSAVLPENGTLKHRYRRLFWPVASTIGLSNFSTIVLTLVLYAIISCCNRRCNSKAVDWQTAVSEDKMC